MNLFRRLWGTGVLGLMLSVLADFAPTVAGPFALLVLLGSLTHGGDQAIQNALGKISAPTSASPTSSAATRNTSAATTSTAPAKAGAK